MSTEPDLRKASQKQESQTGRASLASTDLNTLSSHVTTPTQVGFQVSILIMIQATPKMILIF